jgi:hypothetical protein
VSFEVLKTVQGRDQAPLRAHPLAVEGAQREGGAAGEHGVHRHLVLDQLLGQRLVHDQLRDVAQDAQTRVAAVDGLLGTTPEGLDLHVRAELTVAAIELIDRVNLQLPAVEHGVPVPEPRQVVDEVAVLAVAHVDQPLPAQQPVAEVVRTRGAQPIEVLVRPGGVVTWAQTDSVVECDWSPHRDSVGAPDGSRAGSRDHQVVRTFVLV